MGQDEMNSGGACAFCAATATATAMMAVATPKARAFTYLGVPTYVHTKRSSSSLSLYVRLLGADAPRCHPSIHLI